MNFRIILSVLLAIIIVQCAPLAGCKEASGNPVDDTSHSLKKKHGNVLLIIADDQGLDMGAYGNKKIQTPHLDELALQGTVFTNGFATVSSCSPSRSVIYSGLFSHTNGMYGLAHDVHNQHYLPWVQTIPSLLKKNGYATCLVGKKHILPPESLPFDQELAPEHPGKRDVALMADEAARFIDQHKLQPFFLVIGFSDPHREGAGYASGDVGGVSPPKYDPRDVIVPSHLPDLPAVRKDLANYYESISRMDSGVGLLLEKLKNAGRLQDTLIIYLSDNGRPFPGGKTTLYDDGIHLPLVVFLPGQLHHGVRNDALVSWIDIVPTILDFTGTPPPASYKLPGKSLLPILDQEHSPDRQYVYGSHNFHEINQYYPMRAIRTHQYKYIANLASPLSYPLSSDILHSPTWAAIKADPSAKLGKRSLQAFFHRPVEELYDVSKDPDEVKNLVDNPSYAEVLKNMRVQMKSFQLDTHDPWAVEVEEK